MYPLILPPVILKVEWCVSVRPKRNENFMLQNSTTINLPYVMTKLYPQNRHKFAILILWVLASAISIPRNISITAVNMAAVTNNTSQIKIPPCTFFTDRAQH